MREGETSGPARPRTVRQEPGPRPLKAARDSSDRAARCPPRRPQRGAPGLAGHRVPFHPRLWPSVPRGLSPSRLPSPGDSAHGGHKGSLCPSAHGRLPRPLSSPGSPDRRISVHRALPPGHCPPQRVRRCTCRSPCPSQAPSGHLRLPPQRPSSRSLGPKPRRWPPLPCRRHAAGHREEAAVVRPPTGRRPASCIPAARKVPAWSRGAPCEDTSPDLPACGGRAVGTGCRLTAALPPGSPRA